ncbi:MAG: SsrA-binding protein [Algibacter sp.]
MKKQLFKIIAKINKSILPSYSKKQLNLVKATKFQMAIIGWRSYITKNALD